MLEFLARNPFLRPLFTTVNVAIAVMLAASQPEHRTLYLVWAALGCVDLLLQGYTAVLGRKKTSA
ncbi:MULTISPECIES: hypothetical protein [Streptomyces]|uniref:hypothetical protein n=1 Tax=Streptomyces TaxID=1883 RepID=UPI000F6C74E1|nr:hypothetical protein [Streptomyces sp. W1SF4]AZM90845.1 hypothetical protein D1J60_22275 [Streptomyces sp. W1SF4]